MELSDKELLNFAIENGRDIIYIADGIMNNVLERRYG